MKIGDMDLCDLIRQLRAEFFAKDGDVTVQAGRNVYVSGGGEISVPVGGIILWSGSVASIPTGWALCDGSSGTPDLTDRFVIGAGDTYDPGDTGGATTDTSSSDSHTHDVTGSSSSESSHTHSSGSYTAAANTNGTIVEGAGTTDPTEVAYYTHTHDVSGTSGAGSSHSHGSGSYATDSDAHTHTVDIVPPYYALAYIMRTT